MKFASLLERHARLFSHAIGTAIIRHASSMSHFCPTWDCFQKWGYPKLAGWFISWKIRNSMDDLGVPPFQEMPISSNINSHWPLAKNHLPTSLGSARRRCIWWQWRWCFFWQRWCLRRFSDRKNFSTLPETFFLTVTWTWGEEIKQKTMAKM